MVKINQDGSIDVITALMDHGGGTLEAIAKLIAEALCVPLDKVNLSPAGTRTTVYDVVTHATRGRLRRRAARRSRPHRRCARSCSQTASWLHECAAGGAELRMDEKLGQGVLYVPSIPDKRITIGEIATRCWTESWKTIAAW